MSHSALCYLNNQSERENSSGPNFSQEYLLCTPLLSINYLGLCCPVMQRWGLMMMLSIINNMSSKAKY